FLPLQSHDDTAQYLGKDDQPDKRDPEHTDNVMLLRRRLSRILFQEKLFDYPISLSPKTLANLGLGQVMAIVASYIYAILFPIRPESDLETFFINRFGRKLYSLFFKDYTEKVWGVPCNRIDPHWGAQRVKGLSLKKTLFHAVSYHLLK